MATENEEVNKNRAWYHTMDSNKSFTQSPVNIQFPKSKWDSEAEEGEIADDTESQGESVVQEETRDKDFPMQEESGKLIFKPFL